jgi:hypothetical protein
VVDLGWRQSSALDDVVGTSARLGSRVGALATGDIEDVEFAASGGLNSVFDGGIVRDMVSIHDIVVPVPTTQLQHRRLEAELADP